jgi:RimJ/RimL family protein N-acetyltransferase
MPGKVVLETPRLILREFVVDDAEAFYELNSDPEVTRYTGDGGVRSVDEAREGLLTRPIANYAKHGFGRLACVLKESGRLIGFAGLKYLDELNEVDIGYRLMKAYWGQGLATEASRAVLDDGFQRLGMTRILGLVDPANVASVRVLLKLGLKPDGEAICFGQKAAKYLITADEWRERRGLTR